jgi:hypothetical protein
MRICVAVYFSAKSQPEAHTKKQQLTNNSQTICFFATHNQTALPENAIVL